MGEAIEKTKNAITVWDDLENVRAQFAPTLTDKEFKFFVTLGSSLKANPFKREIWAVKYDKTAPASIFLGRDMYRRKAQEQPDYDGHIADAVYAKDKFIMENGQPKHSYSLADRGDLLGAYCVVYKKNQSHPFYTFVKLAEYDKGFALWKNMKETLIKKVAEAQGLRGAFQGVFAGTYDESEQWEAATINNPKANVSAPPLKPAEQESNYAEAQYKMMRNANVPKVDVIFELQAEAEPPRPEGAMFESEMPKPQPGQTEPPDDGRPQKPSDDENTVEGLKNKIRDNAAEFFPNPNSFSLWLKTLTTNEEKGYRGVNSLEEMRSFKQLQFVHGALKRKMSTK